MDVSINFYHINCDTPVCSSNALAGDSVMDISSDEYASPLKLVQ